MTIVAKSILFLLGSAALAWLSRSTLRNPRAHGFYRFFAWEAILALFLTNATHWFEDPFSAPKLLAWLLLTLSAFLVFASVSQFRKKGRIDRSRRDPSLVSIEKTTSLVTSGVYRYIRHPMYASLLHLSWGILLKDASWTAVFLTLVATVMLFITARLEERENLRYFGEPYREYMKRTKMFVPYLI